MLPSLRLAPENTLPSPDSVQTWWDSKELKQLQIFASVLPEVDSQNFKVLTSTELGGIVAYGEQALNDMMVVWADKLTQMTERAVLICPERALVEAPKLMMHAASQEAIMNNPDKDELVKLLTIMSQCVTHVSDRSGGSHTHTHMHTHSGRHLAAYQKQASSVSVDTTATDPSFQ